MIEDKGLGNKKINRVGLSLSNEYSFKLNRLATACGMKPTTLARMILQRCLDDPAIVNSLQQDHCKYAAYKILLVNDPKNGGIKYILANPEREDFR